MTEETKQGKFDAFLVDASEANEDHQYIQPNIEVKLPKGKRQECRDIIAEIKKFGVTQRQVLFLIYLLSLELENQEVVRALAKAIGDNREKIPVVDAPKKSKIILPGQE